MQYTDMGDLPEDKRIELIAAKIHAEPWKRIHFIVESEEKAKRYLEKLAKLNVVEASRMLNTPIQGAIMIKVKLKMG